MGKLLLYSGTTTKIRAMKGKLLTRDDYGTLISMTSVAGALAFLKQTPSYEKLFAGRDTESLHRNEVEQILVYSVYEDFQKIYRFSNVKQRQFMDLYFGRYEVALIKRSMRMLFDHRNIHTDLTIFTDFFNRHSSIRLEQLSLSQTIEEFVENLKGSIYYAPLKQLSGISSPTLWDYEMALDLFYFKWMWEKGQKTLSGKSDRKAFMDAYGVKIDLLNVQWIYRSKKYYRMDTNMIYDHLIPVQYHLSSQDIKNLVETENPADFEAALLKTYYGRHYSGYSPDMLDKVYPKIRHDVQRKNAAKDPYSVASLISYLYEKEHEIGKLTIILECLRYGLSREEIIDYINVTERKEVVS